MKKHNETFISTHVKHEVSTQKVSVNPPCLGRRVKTRPNQAQSAVHGPAMASICFRQAGVADSLLAPSQTKVM
jgi:hypothetical protein